MTDVGILPVNTLAGRGHNSAAVPLAEVLSEELALDKARADELLASAGQARIESAADAGKVADLIALIRDAEKALDRDRDVRKRPLLHEQRVIEAAFGAVIGPLARARTGVLVPMLTAWQQEHDGAPLPTSIAAVGSRRKPEWVIESLPAVIDWLLNNRPGPLSQAIRTIVGAEVTHAGVDAVERGEVVIPGVSISIAVKTQVR
jgi:hypothetical protein